MNATTSSNKCNTCNKSLTKNKIDLIKSNSDICSICLDTTDTVLSTCKHHFHEKCIKKHCKNK